MSNKFFLFGLILFISLISHAQNSGLKNNYVIDKALFHVLYQFEQVVLSFDNRIIQSDTMSLLIGNTYSLYTTYNKMLKDSLLEATKKEVDLRQKVVNHYGTYDEFISKLNNRNNIGFWSKDWETADLFKNRQRGKLIILDELDGVGSIRLEDVTSPQNWNIGTDTMSILGYTCHSATVYFRGRKYTAWFAHDIPINDGPWKFYDLPGLILQIEDSDKLFKFIAIGLESVMLDTLIKINESKKYQITTLKQYNKLKVNYKKNARYFSLQGSELNMFSGENRTKYNQIEIEE